MRKYILGAAIMMVAAHLGFCQQLINVRDQSTLQPVEGVTFSTLSGSLLSQTNAKGLASLNVLPDKDTLLIQHPGFDQVKVQWSELSAANFTVSLHEKHIVTEEVVISATRFEEDQKHVAQQIFIINSKEISLLNQPSTADLLQNTGQVLVQKSQLGGGSPIIRGFEASRVLMVVDGVRMNNAIYRAGHLQNVITIDQFMLDRTEIAYGPSSVMYGSDALGGTMNFITRKPTLGDSLLPLSLKANAILRYSSAMNENTGHVDFNVGSKKIASLTGFTFSSFGDLRTGSFRNHAYGDWGKRQFYTERIDGKDVMIDNRANENLQKGTGYQQLDVFQKILFQPNKRINNTLSLQYSESGNINRYDRLTEMDNKGIFKSAEWYYGPQKRLFLSNTLQLSSATMFYDKSRIIIGYQDVEESRHDRKFGRNILNHRTENVKVYSLNIDLHKNAGFNELTYGLEATYNEVGSRANTEDIVTGAEGKLDTRYPGGGSEMKTIAAYVTDYIELSKKIIVSGGLRFTNTSLTSRFNDQTFFPFPFSRVTQNNNALTGNLGLVYQPGYDWRFSIIGSTGFKSPNVDDLVKVFESVAGRLIVPNPDLKPEKTYNIDLGVSKMIQKQINISANGFYTWYNDAAIVKPSQFEGKDSILYNGKMSRVVSPDNAQRAYLYGVSAKIQADLTKSFFVTSSVTYTYARIRTDSTEYPLDHIPPAFGKTSANLHLNKFRAECSFLYNGWKRLSEYNLVGEDNIIYATSFGTPSWITMNFRTSYQINQYVQAQVAVENIFDAHYRVFASGISAPGRNFIVSLRGSF